jgi:hypothetical protein
MNIIDALIDGFVLGMIISFLVVVVLLCKERREHF